MTKSKNKPKQAKMDNQSNEPSSQPMAPVQFFYKKIQEEKNTKQKEREILETQERHQGLTKKEKNNLSAKELKQQKRESQIVDNKTKERYGPTGPRQKGH